MASDLKESCLSRGIQRCGCHVCVLGVIASGKSTLANALHNIVAQEEGECHGFYEPVEDNPLLPLYYQDPHKYAFPMQIYMLNRRYEQQMLAQDLALAGISSVQDSSVFGDTCFVEMLKKDGIMSQQEVDVYSDLFVNLTRNVMYPTLVVYLNCEPEKAIERLKHRNRDCESNVPVEYLSRLKAELDEFINDFQKYTFVKEINANVDLTHEGIVAEAQEIYNDLQIIRKKPIISRMGV